MVLRTPTMLAPTVGQLGASSAPGHLGAAVMLGRKSRVLTSCSTCSRAGRQLHRATVAPMLHPK